VNGIRAILRSLATKGTALSALFHEFAESTREKFGRHVPKMMGDPHEWYPGGQEVRLADQRTSVCLQLLSAACAIDRVEDASERARAWAHWLWTVRENWDVIVAVQLKGDEELLERARAYLHLWSEQ